jgi:DNA mismatch repair protein MutS
VSILFDQAPSAQDPTVPAYFGDLNLDQIIDSIVAGRDEYDLKPLYRQHLREPTAIEYRQDILRDAENAAVRSCLDTFAEGMRACRANSAQAGKLRERYQRERFVLDAVASYCAAVRQLSDELTEVELTSRGMLQLRVYLNKHVASDGFRTMVDETAAVQDALSRVSYSIHTLGFRVTVRRYNDEADYSSEVQKTFERFEQGAVKDYHVKFFEHVDMNHVEASILELVARLYPEEFGALDRHFGRYSDQLDPVILRFEREVQFYLSYLDYTKRFTESGLAFSRPRISADSKAVSIKNTFDLALANILVQNDAAVVCNDFSLSGAERIFVVSGPNQGGKTTFARTFGQAHYLASLGLLVPGEDARLYLFDELFTHFEKEEDLGDFTGKLEDDLVRAHEIFAHATSSSIIIMNEIFTSTTLQDAAFLGTKVLERVTALDALCVYVSFVDELASMSEATVSMVSTVNPQDPAERTYKVVRQPADGLSYAIAIAQKYGLTYERLKDRISA